MFEERYNNMMEGVEPSTELVQRTLHAGKSRKSQPMAWKPALIIALCVVMVVGAAAWRVMHTAPAPPVVAAENTAAISPVSDTLILSVNDVTLIDAHEMSFVLTVQGELVDPQTSIDVQISGLPHSGRLLTPLEPLQGQSADERRFRITLTSDDQPLMAQAEDTLELSVIWYTSGDTYSEVVHEIDWSTVTADSLPRIGSPLIPLGGDVALTALAYSPEDGLQVQLRWPFDSWETTLSYPQLVLADTGEYPEDFIQWRTTQYVADGWCLHNTAFQVTREELSGLRLITCTNLTGRVITGDWRISIDLTPLKAK